MSADWASVWATLISAAVGAAIALVVVYANLKSTQSIELQKERRHVMNQLAGLMDSVRTALRDVKQIAELEQFDVLAVYIYKFRDKLEAMTELYNSNQLLMPSTLHDPVNSLIARYREADVDFYIAIDHRGEYIFLVDDSERRRRFFARLEDAIRTTSGDTAKALKIMRQVSGVEL